MTSSWQITRPQAVWLTHGSGSKIYDVDGTEYVDLHGGYGAGLAGHAHPAIVEAVRNQVARGTHFAQPTEDAILVAEELARRFGLPLWRFTNSGTESTMDAVHLMPRDYRSRPDREGGGLLPRPPRLGPGVGAAGRGGRRALLTGPTRSPRRAESHEPSPSSR